MDTKQAQYSLLIISFLSLAGVTLTAHFNPATSYELSIYDGTPVIVWIGICFSLFIALGLAFNGTNEIRRFALFLAGISFMIIVMLPLIRGYYHLGEGDTMSHAGRVRELLVGSISPMELGYPAVHLLVLFIKEVMNIPTTQAFFYIAYTFIMLFILFIPLTVRMITNIPSSLPISVFAAIFLLPVNLISVSMTIHPTSQAILFIGLLLYIFVYYVKYSDFRCLLILPIISLALIALHPQQAANFLLLLGTVALIQPILEFTKVGGGTRIQTVYFQTLIFAIMFWIWFKGSRFIGSFTSFIVDLFFTSQASAEEVSERGSSLIEVGAGPEELFVKLFLVSLIFCLIASGYMTLVLVNRFRGEKTEDEVPFYLTVGLVPPALIFISYVVANVTTQYFRHLGFIMVIITLIGSLGFGRFLQFFFNDKKRSEIAITCLFIVFLSLSLLVVYPSPYVYQATGHVPEGQVSGYETAFDHRVDGVEFLSIRSSTARYAHFHLRGTRPMPDTASAPDHFANQDLANHYTESKYLVITSNDRKLDSELYSGLRYSSNDFRYVETHPTISRVQSTGDLELYIVDTDRQEETTERTPRTEESELT